MERCTAIKELNMINSKSSGVLKLRLIKRISSAAPKFIIRFLLTALLLLSSSLAAGYNTEFADTVTLSSSSLPYTVSQSNLLILTNGNLSTSGTAIDIGDFNDIMIDGGGDTIYFGGGAGDNSYGVKLGYSPERIQIRNVTLIHNVSDNSQARGCDPIHIMGDDSVFVENVDMVARGVEGNCIDATTLGGNGISNLWIKDCECENLSHSYENRSGDPASAIRVCADASSLTADQYTGKLENVTVITTPHSAIYVTGGTTSRPKMIIHDCNLTVDAHNDMYDITNATSFHSSGDAYAISAYRLGAGSQIYNNVIRSGFVHEGGQGMIIQGAQGTASQPIDIYNNDIQIHNGPNAYNLRAGTDGKSVGLYLRWPAGNSDMSNCYVHFNNNLIKAYADGLSSTLYTGGSAQGIRIHVDSGFNHCEVINNRVFALRSDSLSPSGDVTTIAGMFAQVDVNRNDTFAQKNKLGIEGNTFYGNFYYAPETPLNLGSIALHELGGGSLRMFSDTLYVSTSAGASRTIEFPQEGTFRFSSSGSHLIDYAFMGYADDEGIVWGNINTDDNGLGKDVFLDRIAEFHVQNNLGQSISGAQITVTNNYSKISTQGYSDGSGNFEDTVAYKGFKYNSPASTNTWYDSLAYNNFRVVAKSGSDSAVSVLTIDDETTFPITLTLNGGGSSNTAPTTPSASSPGNGAVLTDLTPALVINNSYDVDGDDLSYTFQVSTNSAFTNVVALTTSQAEGGGSTTTWNVSPALSEGTYYWRARAYDGQVYSGYSSVRVFSIAIANSAPSTPTASIPANGAVLNDLNPVLVINNSSDADGDDLTYNFQVASDAGFSNIAAEMPAYTEGGGTTTAWAVSPSLSDGGSYYWRARAYDGEDYSGWSSSRTFSIALVNNAPNAPAAVSPEDSAYLEDTTPTLVVNNAYDADGDNLSYSFEVSANEGFTNIVGTAAGLSEGSGSTTSWTVTSALSRGETYYWRSRVYDGEDYSNWSTVRLFNIVAPNSAPSTPTLATPANGAQVTDVRPSLTINNSSDSDGDALVYHYQVSSSAIFSSLTVEITAQPQGGGSTTTWQVSSNLHDGNTYYWRVRAFDGEDYSSWSGSRSFVVNLPNNPPTEPSLVNPLNASVVTMTDPLLTINNSSDDDGDVITYHFQVGYNAAFSVIAAETTNLTRAAGETTSWQVAPELSDQTTYYWRVRAYDGEDYSDWTSAWSFSVDLPNTPPNQPTLASPGNGAYVTTSQPQLAVNNSSDGDGDDLTYFFEISSTSNFSAIVQTSAAVNESGGSTTAWTAVSDLNNHVNYWWRVRCYDGEDYSIYSQSRVFYTDYTTPNDPPTPPEPDEPPDGSVVDTTMPMLTVTNATDLDGDELTYHFEVWDAGLENKITTSPAVPEGDGSTTSWQVDKPLDNGSQYFWRSRAFDGSDSADWMDWSDFEIAPAGNNAPPTPLVHSPEDGEILLGNNHNLIIYNAVDPDGDPLTYQFRVCNDVSMLNVMEEDNSVAEGAGDSTVYTTTGLFQDGQTYYWAARAYDGELYSDWSTPYSFVHYSLAVDAEDIPVPLYPLEGDEVSTAKPRFKISVDEAGADYNYFFEVADNSDFSDATSSGSVPGKRPNTTWTPDQNLAANRTYYWRVKSENSGWSETISFHVSGDVHLSPNPYKASKHDQVVFHNLPQNANIQVLSVSGEVVKEFNNVEEMDQSWDVTNDQGQPLSSGVYLFYVTSPGNRSSGKLAVIR